MQLNFFKRFIDIATGNEKQRNQYAIENIIYMAISVVFTMLLVLLYNNRTSGYVSCETAEKWFLSWLGIFVLAVAALESFFLGLVSQVILLFCTFFALIFGNREEGDLSGFILSLVSLVVVIGGVTIGVVVLL